MRRWRPQRTLYFAGCEGDCERAYVTLLNKIAALRGLHVWIHGEPLNPGAGDPLALVARAVERLGQTRRQGTIYRHVAVFLDADTLHQSPQRTLDARRLAHDYGFQLVWQNPNLEAVLLRHLDGCQYLRPDGSRSLAELKRRWPEYDKSGISADKLAHRIGYQEVERAASVEPELREFLRMVGLIR